MPKKKTNKPINNLTNIPNEEPLEKPTAQETPTEIIPAPEMAKELSPELLTEMPAAKSVRSPKPKPEPIPEPIPVCEPTITLAELRQQLSDLHDIVTEHGKLIMLCQLMLSKKRTPVKSNGKVQILDKNTGITYASKNSVYQTLLKSGELNPMISEGVFGPVPEKNTFGWYTLERAMPGRFQEVTETNTIPNAQ